MWIVAAEMQASLQRSEALRVHSLTREAREEISSDRDAVEEVACTSRAAPGRASS